MKTTRKLLLFDIDGTLISVQRQAARQLVRNVLAEALQIDVSPTFTWVLGGKTDFQIFQEIAHHFALPPEYVEERRELVIKTLIDHTLALSSVDFVERLEGTLELLQVLAGRDDVVLGVLTGNIRQTAYLKLQPHGFDAYFPFGAFGCDNMQRAALPPVALERANVFLGEQRGEALSEPVFTPENTVIIGDTLNDIHCARAHNIPVLAVATGSVAFEDLHAHNPNYIVRDFAHTQQIVNILVS